MNSMTHILIYVMYKYACFVPSDALPRKEKEKAKHFFLYFICSGPSLIMYLKCSYMLFLSGNTTCLQGIMCVLGSAQIPLIVINILWISLKTLNHAKNVLCLDKMCYNPTDIIYFHILHIFISEYRMNKIK